jgi:hypothetical protein
MSLRVWWLLLVFASIGSSAWAATLPAVPEPLRGWEAWVLHGEDYRQCPFWAQATPDQAQSFACVLSGPASIRIAEGRAEISVEVQVYAAGYVALISADQAPPESLMANGKPGIVELRGTDAQLWLEPGNHDLSYALDLSAQPESLRVPTTQRLLSLTVAGQAVFPLNREGQVLWLQRAERTTESDALHFTVHRLWRDQIPQELQTRIKLHVAGKARELRLGPAWPEGFELTHVNGDLPVIVESGRILRVQATAGSFTLDLNARAIAPSNTLSFKFPETDWPEQEIWSFAPQNQLRVVEVNGDAPIDPAQADVPEGWRPYPSFAIASGDALTLTERSRGLGDDANRLSLRRQLWLDFDGAGYTVQDQINGRMRQGFRLDLGAPYTLMSASERGEGLLVTTAANGDRGIEVRYPALNVEAGARLDYAAVLPASGWSERLDALSTTLNLPPGYRLLYAGGVDRAPQAWAERWNIYTVFIAAFAVVVGWRLGGLPLAAAVALLTVLGAHEAGAPRYSLIVLLLLLLASKSLEVGRLRQALVLASALAALVFVAIALPFATTQARYALHPQLADGGRGGLYRSNANSGYANQTQAPQVAGAVGEAAPMPMAPPSQNVYDRADKESGRKVSLEQVQITGSRIKRVDNLERYAKDSVVQAGVGRPSWSWMRVDLGFDGPVDSAQQLRLWLSPPWLTALWRWLLVAAIALIAWLLLRPLQGALRRPGTLTAGLLLLGISGIAGASDIPDTEMLASLKQRLTEAPECAPACARLAAAQLGIEQDRLTLEVDVHAAEQVLVPLPLDDNALSDVQLLVDGQQAPAVALSGNSAVWLAVPRGVHRLRLQARVRAERVALDFAMPASRLETEVPGWSVVGLRDGRLLAERVELVREAPAEVSAASAPARVPVKPFVRVVREIRLDLDWTVSTQVERIAPISGGFSVSVPLLKGEQPSDPDLRIDQGSAEITLQPGSRQSTIESRLARADSLTLTAPDLSDRAEVWRVRVGPSLSLQTSGVPVVEPEDGINEDEVWVHEFHPLPGEQLTLTVSRPAAVPGATLVADQVQLSSSVGARSRSHSLNVSLRATQGGSQSLKLPSDAELLSLSIDGRALNLRPENGVLSLPIKPGPQQLSLSWREDQEVSLMVSTPELDLGLDAANITLALTLPSDRWILRLGGPPVGPAVLYWSSLLVLLAIGWALGRSGRALLPVRSWMLLALGFSTLSYGPLMLVAVSFIALDARQRYLPGELGKWGFDLAQLTLAALSVGAFGALVLAIPSGLLGSPDMHIAGGAGSYGQLAWLADRSSGALPTASAISLPMWSYKLLMLAFALWLASALIGWIKLAWQALVAGTGWMRLRPLR